MSIAYSRRPRSVKASPPTRVPIPAIERAQAADDEPSLDEQINRFIDDEGMPRGGELEEALPMLAAWTRSLAARRSKGLSDVHEDLRYQRFVECLLRLTRRDGSIALTRAEAPAEYRAVWRAVAPLLDPAQQALLAGAVRGRVLRTGSRPSSVDLPPPSANSEPAGLAVLRPSWTSGRLVVDYHRPELRLFLDRGDEPLIQGACNPCLTVDGAPLAGQSRWEQTCWISDEDVDYLEVELPLASDVRVQRHLLFARQDEFVFIADAVLGERPGTTDYRMALPLADCVAAESATETRETTLVVNGRRRARIVPLGLNEWRSERRGGDLYVADRSLEARHSSADAKKLFAAWFIDLAPRRLSRPITWRQLTVAEERQIVPDDVAVGYRVQVGSRQWLFYRSLEACGNRTLLGHNLVSEFLAARFSRKGVPETLIEIEAPSDHNE